MRPCCGDRSFAHWHRPGQPGQGRALARAVWHVLLCGVCLTCLVSRGTAPTQCRGAAQIKVNGNALVPSLLDALVPTPQVTHNTTPHRLEFTAVLQHENWLCVWLVLRCCLHALITPSLLCAAGAEPAASGGSSVLVVDADTPEQHQGTYVLMRRMQQDGCIMLRVACPHEHASCQSCVCCVHACSFAQ